jgi:isopentenyl-diphosphate delta-isomerase
MVDGGIQQRKADHLRIVAEEDVAHARGTLLDCVQLAPSALPEMAFDEIDASCEFFGKPLNAALMITSMTGGVDQASALNRDLASVAGKHGIAFAVGSQRVLLKNPERLPDFAVRDQIGDGVLLGNIGAQQLTQYPPERIIKLIEMIDADGICVHLNPAHELAQDAGDCDFRGQLQAIRELGKELGGRVVVKETGAGLSPGTVHRLRLLDQSIKYIDVAGAGGTSWPKAESYRANEPLARAIGESFSEWGWPTAVCLLAAGQNKDYVTGLIGSGGIATGLDAARAIACGADLVGIARAVLLAYLEKGITGADSYLSRVIHELRAAMLLTGSRTVEILKNAQRIYTGELAVWLDQLSVRL